MPIYRSTTSDISGSTLILWSYKNTFCAQRKQKQRLYSTISSLSCQSSERLWEYYDACMWCCWHRSRRPAIEHPSLLVHRLYILVWLSKDGQKIVSHPLCQNLQTCLLRLFYAQCASSSACKQGAEHPGSMSEHSSTTHICHGTLVNALRRCHGTLVNALRRLTPKRRNCWIKLFLFSLHTKSILVAS